MDWTVMVVGGVVAAAAAIIMRRDQGPIILPEDLQKLLDQVDGVILLDVRTAPEFQSGHIPGARHLPHDQLLAAHDAVPKGEKTIVVCCERGPRSRLVQRTLTKLGYENVLHLKGDMAAWRSRGLPTE